ncbi:MAG TPA: hypothetical protein VEX38_06870 [Fimbriimonadaceae bacterium]|nr:hypothetical protein [Fimbriimonadaceae bacterium]
MALRWHKLPVAEPRHDFVHGTVYRAMVPGGWLISLFWSASHCGGPTVTFYPDPNHEWDGSTLDWAEPEATASGRAASGVRLG